MCKESQALAANTSPTTDCRQEEIMGTARAELERLSGAAPRTDDCRATAVPGGPDLAFLTGGPLRHPRAGLRNAFPAHAVRVLRPKVP